MLRRIALISLLIVALGAGVVIAGGAVQKEKITKTKDQTEQKDKDKALIDSVGALRVVTRVLAFVAQFEGSVSRRFAASSAAIRPSASSRRISFRRST